MPPSNKRHTVEHVENNKHHGIYLSKYMYGIYVYPQHQKCNHLT